MAVSEAIENYLETIYILSQQQNEVHAIDVCSYLSYSRPTVSIVLLQMRAKTGWSTSMRITIST